MNPSGQSLQVLVPWLSTRTVLFGLAWHTWPHVSEAELVNRACRLWEAERAWARVAP